MTPEQLVEQLRAALPNDLRSVVLYGSAAAGDFIPGASSYNVMLVVERLTVAELDALAKPAMAWTKSGNHPPLLFTPVQLASSADAFPIELSDIRQSRKVLFGDDPLVNIEIRPEHLRRQVEHELKGKLLALRGRYLLAEGKPKRLAQLMADSLSTFLVLFRAALRLFEESVPATKIEALHRLAAHVPIDLRPFTTIHELKIGKVRAGDVDARAVFQDYSAAIECIIEAVDHHIRAPSPGA